MTQYNPTFNPSEFELRDSTNPYLTPAQAEKVLETEGRVEGNLDFVAQSLGWSGPNYWGSLATTVSEKRQLLSGTYGVYNSFVIPRIYEIRNWSNSLVVDRLQFIEAGRQTYVERIILGDDVYRLRGVSVEGDKYVIFLGELPQSFYDQVAANVPLRVDIPTYRPAPFRRESVGVSGDASFICSAEGSSLVLHPDWDTTFSFPYKFLILFAGSTYYFDQPVYLGFPESGSLGQDVIAEYNPSLERWVLEIPSNAQNTESGLEGFLVWPYAGGNSGVSANAEVKIQPWVDPSDWGNLNVLENYRGAWNNKGGDLPYNFVFDALSIHGFDESNSVYLPTVERDWAFNDIVNYIYYQKTTVSELAPGGAKLGDLWWNDSTGALAVWLQLGTNCGEWVEIDYRQEPRQTPAPQVVYPDVTSFQANSGSLAVGTIVRIDDVTGLSPSDNVIGVQGALTSPGFLILHRETSAPYWTPDEFGYLTVSNFEADASLLPFRVPVTLYDATGLAPQGVDYEVSNLSITVAGDYEVLLIKYYSNTTWEVYPDSILKYIAYSALFGGPLEGQMWWDFVNADPNTRAATIYHDAWASVNYHPQSGPPAPVLDMAVVLFYCNGSLLQDGIPLVTDDFIFTCTGNPATGKYNFVYTPRTFVGRAQFPVITISDSLTTTYRADISDLVFSGVTYYMSPNVYNSETPLRLWKTQDLQVAETLEHVAEDNFVNPLLADLNNGPGLENWEKYFVRLPLEYGRNGTVWQKVALTCQNFGYWGSSIEPEQMRCPPEDNLPAIYEELFLYDTPVPDYTYVYCEPYLYSNIAYFNSFEDGQYQNSGVFPASDVQFDEFQEAELIEYDPLHNRQADVISPVAGGYGNWLGEYVNINPCVPLTGFLTTDLLNGGVEPVTPPVWDASVYKFPPTCQNQPESYAVDANHYKISYGYFVADASAAEDPFFDVSREASWRYPVTQPKTLYMVPR
jgi:hypothetical protein